MKLTNEQKFDRQIKKLIKMLPDTPIEFRPYSFWQKSNVREDSGRIYFYGKKYEASFSNMNGDEYWPHNFHLRQYDDVSDSYTDYHAGTYFRNLKTLIECFKSWDRG